MSEFDREHWDARYRAGGMAPVLDPAPPPPAFEDLLSEFPTSGEALDVACGRGRSAVWLGQRGLSVWGVDVSPVAIEFAERLAKASGVADRCRFSVFDLDEGLPPGPRVDLVFCHLFRDPRLDDQMIDRLLPGGMLAVVCLSEVDVGPGTFRVAQGELTRSFATLDIISHREAGGTASLLARRP